MALQKFSSRPASQPKPNIVFGMQERPSDFRLLGLKWTPCHNCLKSFVLTTFACCLDLGEDREHTLHNWAVEACLMWPLEGELFGGLVGEVGPKSSVCRVAYHLWC